MMDTNTQSMSLHHLGGIEFIEKAEKHYFIKYITGEQAKLNILNNHVIRFYMSPTGEFLDYPITINPEDSAKITVKEIIDYGYEAFEQSKIIDQETRYEIHTNDIKILFDKIKGTMKIKDISTNKDVLIESDSLSYSDNRSFQTLVQRNDEYFFGGGMQNGRYSHKGENILIAVTNTWDDGGVSSPCPFYWSSYGYGILRNTWQPGDYDFGFKSNDIITSHDTKDFDAFIFINLTPRDILCDYYELTGKPGIMPEYAFYEAHLNAFNRDYWVEVDSDTTGAILIDGSYYKSYKPNENGDNIGVLESLNGNNDNYRFSARAMIDRYKKHDMPLGWFVPNDGYGCGYGQTDSLDGDIHNLKEFAEYALQNGVRVGLWTESNLHPADPMNPKKGERDLGKEVGIANVVALKCDVAWIGCGYSFGLNAVEEAANTFRENTKLNVRPMIITVDGWAGTQRYAGIWSGDQTGGQWEYIRFHIPSYIGSGLSGQPIVGADMDGIFGGGDENVNIRDYQWKTFTPLQLNMDGWGLKTKTPFSFDENPEVTKINRAYLKLKSMLMPYNYTLAHQSRLGLPMVRAMFLEFPDIEFAYTDECQYQFMWGPYLLVAPVYTMEEIEGESVRHGLYLPNQNQIWIDFFTGQKYQGGRILDNFTVPFWKIPVFVKDGSIIPMTNSNNNPFEIQRDNRIFTLYPNGTTSFDVYEDDGISSDYLENHYALTNITMTGPPSNEIGELSLTINKTIGTYKNMITNRSTLVHIMTSNDVENIEMSVNEKSVDLNKVESDDDFADQENVFYFKSDFVINPYFNDSDTETIEQKFLLIKIGKMNVTSSTINITLKNYVNNGYVYCGENNLNEELKPPRKLCINQNKITANCIELQWEAENDANSYEIEKDGNIYSNVQGTFYLFDNLKPSSIHNFRIRSRDDNGISEWSNSVEATTADDPLKLAVKGVRVTCNIPCQPRQEISNFVLTNRNSIWHTTWDASSKDKSVELTFDLGDVYDIDKIEYTPRKDAGNGTFVLVQYMVSDNGKDWSKWSGAIEFNIDNTVKTICLNKIRFRYFKLKVLYSVGGYGSGKSFLFFKSPQ